MTTQELEDAFTDLIIKHAPPEVILLLVKKYLKEAGKSDTPLSESPE